MVKKSNILLSILMIVSLLLPGNIVHAEVQPFDINAKSAILIDAGTGMILYEKNINEQLPPASITKIMTMLLAMEALETNKITLDDTVVISERASKMGGTQLYLEPGERKTVEELMKGVAIRSANDASVALGEHIAGSEDLFVNQMNERAKALGMKDTTFINTNGLPADGHLTTASDIALMSRELIKHKDIHRWLTTWMDTVVVGKKQSTQELVNTNKLIRTYQGANGIKTGYTSEALHCLSASATRGDNTFIAVVIASPTSQVRFDETSKLLDYGFANYNNVPIAKKDIVIGNILINKGKEYELDLVLGEDFNVLVKKGEESKIQKELIIPETITAPIFKGEKVGEIIATLEGKEVGKIDIVSNKDISKASLINTMDKMFKQIVGK